MIYYTKNKDKIEKYQIDIDKNKLANLEEEIIENACDVEHKIAECTEHTFYGLTNTKITRNAKRVKKIDKTINDEPIYRYEYDELSSPLLDLTYLLYHENPKAIDTIFNCDKNIEDVGKQIEKLDKLLDEIEQGPKFDKLLDSMKKLIQTEKKLKRDIVYINKMKDLLTIKLLDTMDKKEVKKAATFLETAKPKYGKAKIKVK